MRTKITLPLLSLGFSFLMLEIFLRLAIAFDLGGLRNPDLYFNHLSDNNYWKLRLIWTDYVEAPTAGLDPQLGWTPPKTAGNPLGLTAVEPAIVDYAEQAVLFFGDSYVAGLTGNAEEAIPQQLDRRLPALNVYNFGVEGYGVDQTYLRLRQASGLFAEPRLLFGILTFDLDRSVLDVFSGPKPRLAFGSDGEMTVHNTPITQPAEAWLADHPPAALSYAAAFVGRTLSSIRASRAGEAYGVETRRAEKERLNGQIIAHAAAFAAERQQPLVFVLFYTRGELSTPSWREAFLGERCRQLVCVDTRPVLLAAAAEDGVDPAVYYLPDGLHLNAAGNAVVADYLAATLPPLWSR